MSAKLGKVFFVLLVIINEATAQIPTWPGWREWSSWSDCPSSQSQGIHATRKRKCLLYVVSGCKGDDKEKCICRGSVSGGKVDCSTGSITVDLNEGEQPPKYEKKWQILRPVGELIKLKIRVNSFRTTNRNTCKIDRDKIELRDLSGLWIGVICSNVSKVLSCSNGVNVTFVSNSQHNGSQRPKFTLEYESVLETTKKVETGSTNWVMKDGTGGSESNIGVFQTKELCYAECKSRKMVNGVTFDTKRKDCYCEFGMTGFQDNREWTSTLIHQVIWKPGDGVGGSESHIGKLELKKDCLAECMKKKKNGNLANGVTFDQKEKDCYCEFGMTSSRPNRIWTSTFIHREPSYCQTCGGTLTEPSGMIEARTSPTGRYLPDENCIWRIKRNKTEEIMITIIRFYAHSEDFLYIKNGLTNQTLHSYSSNMSVRPNDGYSLSFNTRNLVIQFISNRTLQRIGFKLNYTTFTLPRMSTSKGWSYGLPESTARALTASANLKTDGKKVSERSMTSWGSQSLRSSMPTAPSTTSGISSSDRSTQPAATAPTIQPVKPTEITLNECNARFWLEWSAWSECSSTARGAEKGIRNRTRACKDFEIDTKRGNCSLVHPTSRSATWNHIVTTSGGNANNVPCHFPFWYNGRKYRQCTMTKRNGTDPSRYWCATTYNFTRDGKWGDCFGAEPVQDNAEGVYCTFLSNKGSQYSKYTTVNNAGEYGFNAARNLTRDSQFENCIDLLPGGDGDKSKCNDTFAILNKTRHLPETCNFSAECGYDVISETEEEECILATKCSTKKYSTWQPWSNCGDNNIKSRKRDCDEVVFAAKGASNCSSLQFQSKICPQDAIFPSHYYFKNTTDSPRICNSRCADNSNKTCKAFLYPNASCMKALVQSKPCDSVIECNVSNCDGGWANWGECSQICGASTRTRYAYCKTNVACDDVMMETEACLLGPCAVDGQWTEWSPWSSCSKLCFGGLQKRARSCTNPPPSHGGLKCAGIHEESIGCNFFHCPVNGGYGPWSPWSSCDQPCGGGKISRYRQCNYPTPTFGGGACEGVSEEASGCNNHQCKPAKFDVLLKFTNETFSMGMLSRNSSEFAAFSNKVKVNVLQLYKGRSGNIRNITFNDLSNGSVICNFTITFNQSANDELVILQHAIEDVGMLNTMPVKPLLISSPDVPPAPASVTASAKASTVITVRWSRFPAPNNITGFVIFYCEFGKSSWQKSSAGYNDTEQELLMLKEYTLYTIRVFAFTRDGMGASSRYVDCYTKDGVPSIGPGNPKCSPFSSAQLYIEWDQINTSNWNGNSDGYMIRYKEFIPAATWLNTSSINTYSIIENLKPFTRYEVEVAGVTGAGVGKFSWMQCVTAEAAPSSSPDNVLANLLSRDGKIEVSWNPLPEAKTNGILKGYTVYYTIIRRGAEDVAEVEKSVTASKYSARVLLTGIKPYTHVKIEVAAFTIAGEGPRSPSVFIETCQCPKNIFVGWYSNEPYVYGDSSRPVGILSDLVIDTISEICKFCNGKMQHKLGDVGIFFNRTKNGKLGKFDSEKELKRKMDTNAHFFLPFDGREEFEVLQNNFRFILVAYNPGSALLVKKVSPESITDSITRLVLKIWPVLLVVVLMGTISGTLLWIADRKVNPKELNIDSYIRGTLSGIWWSFVTMTTVGYGDITPRSFIGKSIGIFWMLIGPILNSLIIGALTSAITAVMISKSASLYGMTVAAINQSFEYNLAIRRNARVSQTVLYNNNSEVLKALENGVVKGALLDSLSVASMMNSPKLNEMGIEIGKVFKEPHGFGIVLSPEIIPLKTEIKAYIISKRAGIKERIANFSKALENNDASGDYVKTNILGTITSYGQTFKTSAIWLSVAIAVFSIVCLVIRSIYRFGKERRVAAVRTAGLKRLKHLERDICKAADEVTTRVENRFKELRQKHDKEHEKWFAMHNHKFGILGVRKFGTMNSRKITRTIALNDIMLSDLKRHQRKPLF